MIPTERERSGRDEAKPTLKVWFGRYTLPRKESKSSILRSHGRSVTDLRPDSRGMRNGPRVVHEEMRILIWKGPLLSFPSLPSPSSCLLFILLQLWYELPFVCLFFVFRACCRCCFRLIKGDYNLVPFPQVRMVKERCNMTFGVGHDIPFFFFKFYRCISSSSLFDRYKCLLH